MARPTKLTKDVSDKLILFLSIGGTIEHACADAGIDQSTFHRWMIRGEKADGKGLYGEFCKAIKRADATAVKRSLLAVNKRENNWQASAWLLERRWPSIYGRRRIEISGPEGGPVRSDGNVVVYLPDNGRSNTE